MNLKGFSALTDAAKNTQRLVFLLSCGLNILLWIVVLVLFPKNSSTTILHTTAGVGIDFIGEGWQIVTLPAIGTLLIAVNVILARLVQRANSASFWILWIAMPPLQILLIVTYGILFELNT